MTRIATIDTGQSKWCLKCGSPSSTANPIMRHHKGYDSLLGRYHRGISLRYSHWLDCADLCLDCHCAIHYIYEPYIEKWINRTPLGANHFRGVLIGICDRWLAGSIATPKIPKRYKKQFLESWENWKTIEADKKKAFEEWANKDGS